VACDHAEPLPYFRWPPERVNSRAFSSEQRCECPHTAVQRRQLEGRCSGADSDSPASLWHLRCAGGVSWHIQSLWSSRALRRTRGTCSGGPPTSLAAAFISYVAKRGTYRNLQPPVPIGHHEGLGSPVDAQSAVETAEQAVHRALGITTLLRKLRHGNALGKCAKPLNLLRRNRKSLWLALLGLDQSLKNLPRHRACALNCRFNGTPDKIQRGVASYRRDSSGKECPRVGLCTHLRQYCD